MTRRAGRWVWRGLQALLALGLVFLVGRDLALHWQEVVAARPAWRINPLFLAAALALTWLAYLGLVWSWRTLIGAWGRPLPAFTAARIWALASLGRYIPGKVWTIAGLALLAQRAGVPVWMSTACAVVLQLLAIATGIVVAATAGGPLLASLDPAIRQAGVAVALAAGVAIVALSVPVASRWIVRIVPRAAGLVPPPPGPLLWAASGNFAAWLAYGVAFWLVARGTLPEVRLALPLAIGAYAGSYLVGLLAALAPGGIGVRESVIIVLLRETIGLGPAAALAVASRFFITVAELGFVVPFVVLRKRGNTSPPAGSGSAAAAPDSK